MKIGIPRALLYYYYIPFWKTFFEALDMDVYISEETNKRILNQGVKESVAEICVPIKLYVGHVLDLLEKNVDYIFIPRMVSISDGEYFCPKFMGLTDLIRNSVVGIEEKMLTCHIKSETDDISDYRNYLPLMEQLGVTKGEIKQAAKKANEEWQAFRMYNKMGYTINESLEIIDNKQISSVKKKEKNKQMVKIGLLGYVYNIYDTFVSMDITEKFRDLGVEFVTFEMLEEEEILANIQDMDKRLFWTFSNKLLGAGKQMFSDNLDGIIHMTAFGCGPDSFLSKLFELESDRTGIPFMIVRIDEHTGENHLQTRIEAFVDMIKRKKLVV